jgi:hypothetical protein
MSNSGSKAASRTKSELAETSSNEDPEPSLLNLVPLTSIEELERQPPVDASDKDVREVTAKKPSERQENGICRVCN